MNKIFVYVLCAIIPTVAASAETLVDIGTRINQHIKSLVDAMAEVEQYDKSIVGLDSRFQFHPEITPRPTIGEFETEEDFNRRKSEAIERNNRRNAERKRETDKKKQAEKERLSREKSSAELRQQAAADSLRKDIRTEWTFAETITASDLPRFSRESMSFPNISATLFPARFESKTMLFSPEEATPRFSLHFDTLKQAELFKNNLESGKWELSLEWTISVGLPSNGVVRPAWSERVKRSTLEKAGRAVLVGAVLGAMAAAGEGSSGNSGYSDPGYYDSRPSSRSDDLLTGGDYKTVNHPAVTGQVFPVTLSTLTCRIAGLNNLADAGVSIVSERPKPGLSWDFPSPRESNRYFFVDNGIMFTLETQSGYPTIARSFTALSDFGGKLSNARWKAGDTIVGFAEPGDGFADVHGWELQDATERIFSAGTRVYVVPASNPAATNIYTFAAVGGEEVYHQNPSTDVWAGIGVVLKMEADYPTITDVLSNSPAANADHPLVEGDVILGFREKGDSGFTDIRGWELEEIVKHLRGKEGTVIRLKVRSGFYPNKIRTLSIKRAIIQQPLPD